MPMEVPTNPQAINQPPEPEKKPGENLGVWFQRLDASEKYMKQEFRPRYELARKRLRSEAKTFTQGRYPGHNHVNLVYSIGNAFVNSVYFKHPDVDCSAREDAQVESVENTEVKINDIMKDKKVKKTIKRIIWDAYLGGFGARYIDYEYEDVQTGEPIIGQDGMPMMGDDGQPMMKRTVLKNNVLIERVRPDLVRFPRGFDFDTFQDSPWVGFDVLVPLDDVKNNKQFDVNARSQVKGGYYDELVDKDSPKYIGEEAKSDISYAKLHYVFERPKQEGGAYTLRVLSDDVKEMPLQFMEYDKGCVGYPIKFLYFNPLDDDASYPCGDPWLWESQLNAIDKFWMRLLNHTRRMNRKYIGNKRDINPTELTNLAKNEDQEFVLLENKQNTPLTNIVVPVPDNPVAKDNYSFYEVARGLLSELSPKSALSRGAVDDQTETATQANIINANEVMDLDARIDDIREFLIDIVLDIAGILETSLVGNMQVMGKASTGNEIARVAGRGEFTSKLNIDVDVDSMQHANKDVFRRQMLDMVGQLAAVEPIMNKEGKGIKLSYFVEKLFQHMNVRGAEQAIYDLGLRNPQKEHEDAVFRKVPMQVQPKEDSEEHLQGHMETYQDNIALSIYEKLQPGFKAELANHIMDTQEDMQKKQGVKTPAISKSGGGDGSRPTIATETQRANKV